MFIKYGSIYDFISLFAIIVNIYSIYSLDLVLIIGLVNSLFLHDFLKELTTGWYAPLFKRPNGAINCNLFNTGGLVDHKSGFPSGHVTVMSFFMNILLLRKKQNNVNNYNTYTPYSHWKNIIIYNIPIIIMGYARIMKGCHNLFQVVAGYLLGYGVAFLIHKYENEINSIIKKICSYSKNKLYYGQQHDQ